MTHHLHELRILHSGHVYADMSLVILLKERLHRLAHHDVHVLGHRIHRLHVILHRDNLVGVLHAQNLDHLTVQVREVVYLRSGLGQLMHSLILHNPLRHRGRVGVRDRDHLNLIVVRLLG